MLKELQEIED